MYSAPTTKGASSSSNTQPRPILPGYIRMRKVPDFGNNANNCFDFEEAVSFLASPVVTDEKNRKGLLASPVFLMDPCQSGQTPLKIQTLLPTGINLGTLVSGNAAAETFPARYVTSGTGATQVLTEDLSMVQLRSTSAMNTAQAFTIDARNLAKTLAIQSDSTGGTSTLLVEASVNNSNFLTLDSIVTAAVNTKQYVEATVGATLALSPLSFRFIRITAGAAGAGIANTLTVALK